MNFYSLKKLSYLLIIALFCLSFAGCQSDSATQLGKPLNPEEINTTIGTLAIIYQTGATEVRGFGIVAGLAGTGSDECDPDLRKKLIKQIKVEMTDRKSINPDAFINSNNTAVVEVYGLMPPVASKGDSFDLRVAPLSNQTTSLSGGYLYTTNLVEHNKLLNFSMFLNTIAHARGAIYIDQLSDRNQGIVGGYILSGGQVAEDLRFMMQMHNEDFLLTNMIRGLINEKFGSGTANAKTSGEIRLTIPEKYRHDKPKFFAMVRLLYLGNDPVLRRNRILSLVSDLRSNNDKLSPEIALEAIGKSVVGELLPLLSDSDESVRFHAARCLLNMKEDRALKTLQAIIDNPASKFRVDAIKAVGSGANRNDTVAMLNKHLQSEDFDVAFAVYDELRKVRDISVARHYVANDFILDTVMCGGPKRVYVTRQGVPRIVIFGAPINCANNLFVQSDNGDIIINSREGDNLISISRKNPKGSGIIGPLFSSFKVKDLIQTLGEVPKVDPKTMKRPGLAIPYCQIIAILEKMCRTNAIDAKFAAGKLPVFPNIDKQKAN